MVPVNGHILRHKMHHDTQMTQYLDTELFKGMDQSSVRDILKHAQSMKLNQKEMVFRQGHQARKTYLVGHGRLKLTQVNSLGEEIILHYVGSLELAAAMSCITGREYPASAEVIQGGDAIYWERNDLTQLMLEYPKLSLNILEIVQNRFGDVQSRYMDLSTKRVEQRLARTIIRLLDRGGKKVDEGILIDFPITRQDLAEHAGTTLFSASRILSEWEKRNLVISTRKKILIKDLHGLVLTAEDLS